MSGHCQSVLTQQVAAHDRGRPRQVLLYMYLRFQFYFKIRCSRWIQNIRRADLVGKKAPALRHYKLCGIHFETSQFKNASARFVSKFDTPELIRLYYLPGTHGVLTNINRMMMEVTVVHMLK